MTHEEKVRLKKEKNQLVRDRLMLEKNREVVFEKYLNKIIGIKFITKYFPERAEEYKKLLLSYMDDRIGEIEDLLNAHHLGLGS